MIEVNDNGNRFLPRNTHILLNKIFYDVIDAMEVSYTNALYYDLREKYLDSINPVKSGNSVSNIVNKAYQDIRNTNAKFSRKSRIYQKYEKLEIVERLFSEEEYKVSNFRWKIDILSANTYEEKELLANALESYDQFIDAMDAGVISISSKARILGEFDVDTVKFNEILKQKLDANSISYDRYDVEFGDLLDEAVHEMIEDYRAMEDIPTNSLDPEQQTEVYFFVKDLMDYVLYEYYCDMRALTLRLYNVYCYFLSINKDMNSMSNDDYFVLQSAIHYFNLEDESDYMSIDDEYLNNYEDLTTFYRLYIHNLGVILQFAVTQKDEFEELNKPSKEPEKQINPNAEDYKLDFFDLTHKLVLNIKRNKKNE